MAIPSDGQVSFSAIASELGVSVPYSLSNLSSLAGFNIPFSVSNFRGYSAGQSSFPNKYFIVTNNVSRLGRRRGNPRVNIDVGAYELYQKPNQGKTTLSDYTFLSAGSGDQVMREAPVYDRKGNLIGYELQYITLSSSNRKCITDVIVSYDGAGNPSYEVSNNSRGDQFYIDLVQPYI